jgi:NADPH:quinone reductase-like Zn-dependent oxidoreductase
MKAIQIEKFGGLDAIACENLGVPDVGPDEVLVRVKAAGVGPWDAWIRAGKSVLDQKLPLILGAEISGVVEAVGSNVKDLKVGDKVFGALNSHFVGGYAEYARASARMLSRKPQELDDIQAASVPVVAVTALQMLADYGHVTPGQKVLIHGAAGNVGAFAVQIARILGAHPVATAAAEDLDYVRSLGAEEVVDYKKTRFEEVYQDIDLVLDTVGGDTQERSFQVLKPGGALISAVSTPSQELAKKYQVRAQFMLVEVTTERLDLIAKWIESGQLKTHVGAVLPLEQAKKAHELLDAKPHPRGKIVLRTS